MKRYDLLLLLVCFSTSGCADAFGDDATAGAPGGGDEGDVEDDGLDHSPVEHVCAPGGAPGDPFVDCIESFDPVEATFGQNKLPGVVLGPPVGGGLKKGGMDVLALGCGGSVTLFMDAPGIVDGPGADFIVFENAFESGMITFREPARVLVSADGVDWRSFPCDPAEEEPLGCAGVSPVLSAPDNEVDPTDPAVAGGDAFDLADVGLATARYVRLIDVGLEHFPDETWCGGLAGGFDLDAIAAVQHD